VEKPRSQLRVHGSKKRGSEMSGKVISIPLINEPKNSVLLVQVYDDDGLDNLKR
jgi:hypothetical protein